MFLSLVYHFKFSWVSLGSLGFGLLIGQNKQFQDTLGSRVTIF